MSKYPDNLVPEELIAGNYENLQAKIADFIGATASGVHFVFDFDRTLTVRNLETHEDVTTWHILREHLPEVGKKQYQDLFEKYRVLEINGTMTQSDAAEGWSSILDLFVEHRLDLAAVEQDFLDRATIRPGTAELFQLCRDNDIPTIVMSAGIRDVIEMWGRSYGVSPSLLLSTALILDEAGLVIGWHRDTLIHVLNKSETSHPELESIRNSRPKAILVGDSMNDADMASGENDVLRIRILDPRPDEVISIDTERLKTFTVFDAMIESGNLTPLLELTKSIIELSALPSGG